MIRESDRRASPFLHFLIEPGAGPGKLCRETGAAGRAAMRYAVFRSVGDGSAFPRGHVTRRLRRAAHLSLVGATLLIGGIMVVWGTAIYAAAAILL